MMAWDEVCVRRDEMRRKTKKPPWSGGSFANFLGSEVLVFARAAPGVLGIITPETKTAKIDGGAIHWGWRCRHDGCLSTFRTAHSAATNSSGNGALAAKCQRRPWYS